MPKEGLQHSFHQAYSFINITKYVQKIIFAFRVMSRGCYFMEQCQKNVNMTCTKIQTTYLYKITFLIFKVSY